MKLYKSPSKNSTILLIAFVLGQLLLTTSFVLAAPNPFSDKLYSIDPYDQNQQWMAIGGRSDRHPIIAFDQCATACTPEDAEELYPTRIEGWDSMDGLTFTVDVAVLCQTGPQKSFLDNFTIEFQHDPATSTLTDPYGAVWHQ